MSNKRRKISEEEFRSKVDTLVGQFAKDIENASDDDTKSKLKKQVVEDICDLKTEINYKFIYQIFRKTCKNEYINKFMPAVIYFLKKRNPQEPDLLLQKLKQVNSVFHSI